MGVTEGGRAGFSLPETGSMSKHKQQKQPAKAAGDSRQVKIITAVVLCAIAVVLIAWNIVRMAGDGPQVAKPDEATAAALDAWNADVAYLRSLSVAELETEYRKRQEAAAAAMRGGDAAARTEATNAMERAHEELNAKKAK
jgi:hypothetical protein